MTGTTSRPGLPQVPIDRWAKRAMDRPWRYATIWAIGVGTANLGLRMLLNDLSLARNTRLAALTALGFLLFAWLYTAQLTRPLRRPPRPDTQTEARFKEVTVRSSSAVGIDGHQWHLQCAPRARLPCRAICECGWTSTAGRRTQVLLELKGHLEETLRNAAQQSRQGGNHDDL
jgi:hypothetical protein